MTHGQFLWTCGYHCMKKKETNEKKKKKKLIKSRDT